MYIYVYIYIYTHTLNGIYCFTCRSRRGLAREHADLYDSKEKRSNEAEACMTLLEMASEMGKEVAAQSPPVPPAVHDELIHPLNKDGQPWRGDEDILLAWNEFQR
jgi:hypothetical protein